MSITLYHNPRCSKSRETLAILEESGKEFKTIEYLKTPLSKAALVKLFTLLQDNAHTLIRSKEPLFQELNLSISDKKSWEEWAAIIEKHPILMERPLVVAGNKAIIGRPPEIIKNII